MRDIIKQHIPAKTLNTLRSTRDWCERFPEDISAACHPWRIDSCRKLQTYHDRYRGKRCFVIGNGPSLKNTDLSKLKNE